MTASVIHVRNLIDGVTYRASIVETGKNVTFIGRSLFDEAETATIGITTEAAIGKSGSFWSVLFPAFVVGYCSDSPPQMDHKAFCDFLGEALAVSGIRD